MDKLALEEAGFTNVVSVPDGAPARVKEGDLPPAAEDAKYSYLWNCRAWLDQVWCEGCWGRGIGHSCACILLSL